MNPNKINHIKWIKYLEREQELFIFASFVDAYGKMFKKVTGFGFEKQLHHYKDKIGIFYREEKEMKECDNYFANLIDKKDKKINDWIQKEKEIWEKRKLFTKFNKVVHSNLKNVRIAIKTFHEALLYNTVIPYRLMSALQHTKLTNKKLYKKLEEIRSRSLYPILFVELIEPLFNEIMEKEKVPKDVVSMITPQELIAILQNDMEVSEDDLKKRKFGCYFYLSNEKIIFYYGNLHLEESKIKYVWELNGTIACQGIVRGRVKIVNNLKQMAKFQRGDILLSINTNPSLMSIIEKASAIVTDEGGLLCHAAIVSRELGIPCIIGTKFATKVFADGDRVEVDAVNGVIKRL